MRSGASVLLPLLLAGVVAACASTASPTAAPTASPAMATAEMTPVATIAPTGSPAPKPGLVPAQLIGKWQADFGGGDLAVLQLKEQSFSIVREGSANGRLELIDGALLFSHSSLCSGDGRYTWTLDGDKLHLESIGTDQCDGRAKSLNGVAYIRLN